MNKTLTLLLLLTAVFLAACAGQDTATPTAEPAPPTAAAEAAPTDALAPTDAPPTAEPTAPVDYIDTLAHTADPELVNIPWQWVSRADSAGATTLTVPDPAAYTLEFFPEGTFTAQLDCNTGNGRYATSAPGQIFMELGPVTMAECSPQSLAVAMANLFGPAQSYRLEDEGQTLILGWAADGGVDTFRHPDAPPLDTADAPDESALKAIPEDAISLDTTGLAESFAWEVRPGIPMPQQGPGRQGYPDHILLTFDGELPEDALANNSPRLYIYPKQAYLDLYAAEGNEVVAAQVARLEELIAGAAERAAAPEGVMPLLPPPESMMDRWVQFADLDFGAGTGVRYVSDSPFRPSLGPWTNVTTDYYYQGLSSDGRFYVSLIWPVSTAALPDTPADAPEDVNAAALDPATNPAYQAETQEALNALAPADWAPDLAQLDALVASLDFPLPGAEETPQETPEATAEPAAEATAEPAPEATAEATSEPLPEGPTAVVNAPDGIFVRSGPGTQFTDIGVLATNERAPIVGRSADGQWWAIEVPLTWSADGQGWVSAQFVDASGAEDVPVLAASAPATAAPAATVDPAATATATPVPPPADSGTSGGATGIQFRVVSFGAPGGEQSLIEGTTITATFSDTDVVGSAGCNDYSGRLTPVEDYFTVGSLAVTERACTEPAGIMEQEQAFLAALAGTTGFEWARQIVDGSTVITAGQLFYALGDGTSGVINLVAN